MVSQMISQTISRMISQTISQLISHMTPQILMVTVLQGDFACQEKRAMLY